MQVWRPARQPLWRAALQESQFADQLLILPKFIGSARQVAGLNAVFTLAACDAMIRAGLLACMVQRISRLRMGRP